MEMHSLPLITNHTDLRGTYVLVRASLNVPIKNGVVVNAFRIEHSLSTIDFLRAQGARIILCSHLGKDGEASLQPVFEALQEHFPLRFSSEVIGEETTALRNSLQDGDVLLLQNLRKDPREKEDDVSFARELAALADVFVNDDFAASHRAHASLHAICSFLPSYIGVQFIRECEELARMRQPQSPSLCILGGAKFQTKLPLALQSRDNYDELFIGGALAHDIWRAKGFEVGRSLVSDIDLSDSPLVHAGNVFLPPDVVVEKDGHTRITTPDAVQKEEMIVDAGPATVAFLAARAQQAHTILWNGPLGNYEIGYASATENVARAVAEADGFSVVGGGDTIASIQALHLQDKFGFLSTAGGAMLTFLETGTLPGIDAIRQHTQ